MEFETKNHGDIVGVYVIRIYSVGVWNSKNMELPKKWSWIRIYSVGVWNFDEANKESILNTIRIYSVGVWNDEFLYKIGFDVELEFTPLEFETNQQRTEFKSFSIRIYSVGVWNAKQKNKLLDITQLEFTPLEFETR